MTRISDDVEKPSLILIIDSLPPKEKSLLSRIDTITESSKGKTAYQEYTCKIGSDVIEAIIPIKESRSFDLSIGSIKSKVDFLKLLFEHQGKLK